LSVTRWRSDTTCDDWGSYIYLRDVESGDVWSASYHPTRKAPDSYAVLFNEDRAEYSRRDGDLTTTLDVVVSAEDDSEARRIAISNSGRTPRVIEITSYVELSLATQLADVAHPAFSKLFVETERLASSGALLAQRRKRGPDDVDVFAAHLMVVEGKTVGNIEFETDRSQFLGRGRAAGAPRAMEGRSLSGSTGTVLDPIFALRSRIELGPGAPAHVTYWTMVGSSRDAVLDLIDKNGTATSFERAAALAWTQAQVQLHHLRMSAGEAAQFQRLAGHLLYPSPSLRPPSDMIQEGAGPQTGLWSLGISGDLSIIVLRVSDAEHIGIVRELVQAADYWRMKRLVFDIVILNERGSSYSQELQNEIESIVRTSLGRAQFGERPKGGVFVLSAHLISPEIRELLLSAARVVLVGQNGRLAGQLQARRTSVVHERRRYPRRSSQTPGSPVVRPTGLEYFNGLGGFAKNGREYVIVLGPGQNPPAPWINVVANPIFGFQVSESGAGYSWALNSRERQVTPWSNDPVRNPPGQCFFVRDDETWELCSPTASPLRDEDGVYIARHGQGYSRFEHNACELELELLEYVPLADPLKISRLKIRNTSNRTRRLSVTSYAEWVLGPSRRVSAVHTVTAIDEITKAILARNKWSADFGERVAFVDLGGRQTSWTGDRTEFIGRNGNLDYPAALCGRLPLSNRVGAGFDPCGVLQA
ncbi:MAG: glycosyl transferase, partial [Acidobacteria bacterium]|nr:glycosyl transferase [Acidobacteriota bacterium]